MFSLLASLASVAKAQTVQTLIDFTSSWRFDQSGRDLGTAWRAFGYVEDATWQPLSPGLLAAEDVTAPYEIHAPIRTPLSISSTVTSYYFRTTFQFSGATNGVRLIATNLVDDGAAIYLNGVFVGGVRNPATYNATTFFTGPAVEGQLDVVTNISPGLLRQGANVMAVEVHQSGAGSSDILWGSRFLAFRPTTLTVTNQPISQTVQAGELLLLEAGVTGGPAFYIWQKQSANNTWQTLSTSGSTTIGENTSFFAATNASLSHSGAYRVVITNTLTSFTSQVATVTVTEDLEGPVAIRAVVDEVVLPGFPQGIGSNVIQVVFNERLNVATARNTNNYRLIPVSNPNARVAITNIQYSAGLQAFLYVSTTDSNWSPTNNYYVLMNGISDAAANNINPNSVIGVTRLLVTNLTQMADTWGYYDCAPCDENPSEVYLNEAWTKTNFVQNPFTWGAGPGIFARESANPTILCAGDELLTGIIYQPDPTLFRTTFRTPTTISPIGSLRFRYLVDDGMLVYLNGRPIFSNNVVGPITQASRASGAFVGSAACTNIEISVNNLLPGTNWLTVAVVQHPVTHEADTVFGLEMDLVTRITGRAPTNHSQGVPKATPRLTMSRVANNLVFSWPATNYGWALQVNTNKFDPSVIEDELNWKLVKDQYNPYTNTIQSPRVNFYRLRRENLN